MVPVKYVSLSGLRHEFHWINLDGYHGLNGAAIRKIFAVRGILKDCPSLDTAANDVMQGSGGVYPCFSEHVGRLTG